MAATHIFTPAHDTLSSSSNIGPGASGLGTIDHVLPSQRSVSVRAERTGSLVEKPTARQYVGVAHDTPSSSFSWIFARFGLATIVHLAPSQCMINVLSVPLS